ncbi:MULTISPECIES: undecaprenyl-phosphate glucose phosphotransferase [Anaerostipes]|uniref:undecaprenyl-phosphate glucose phosphotransferase n=1 Tax=Anaerostipes TaxID=207244 RepID=UPI0009529D5C|nr:MULTISPECIES: undecaprenyl-phosphate glucose phosphotransferase [Anaerostipes]MCI5622546.1 undecaprenyl-phosphate glucose phosphotransferase [Anaerostipes sp.]MDY2726146.1 undecaprenyl-phosphate glucose phosphotransferase [Anaerostipes faecalis]OLR59231.1 undecaprenyl-phosphate glucose phosphotransferase [Anaerostipes sp. 494a]
MIKKNQTYLNRLHVLIDALCIYFSGFVAYYVRFCLEIFGFKVYKELFEYNRYYFPFKDYQKPLICALIILLLLYAFFGLYTPKRYQRGSKELVNLFKANVLGLGISAFIITIFQIQNFPRSLYLMFYIFNFIFGVISRYIIRKILKINRKKGRNIKHTVFVGFSTSAAAYIDRIIANPHWGLKVHGIFDNTVSENFDYRGVKYIGKLSDLADYLEHTSLDEVAITLNLNEYDKLEKLVAVCEKSGVHTKFVPDYYNFISTNPYTEDLDGLPVINIRNVPLTNTLNRMIKRFIDIIGSIVALILFSPIMLVVAILVKRSSPGPILFAQERIGLGNKPFKMYKFRSMGVQDPKKEAKQWTTKNDARVTPVGKIIRKTSLDELPQFWNVLRGDMSLIGPRPERPLFVEKFKEEIPRYMIKHQVRPGITGWAQVNGFRGDTSIRGRIEHDLYYIENWSLGLDIKILFLTFFKGFVNKNAY